MPKSGDKPEPLPGGGKHEKQPTCSCMTIRGNRVPDLSCPVHKGS